MHQKSKSVAKEDLGSTQKEKKNKNKFDLFAIKNFKIRRQRPLRFNCPVNSADVTQRLDLADPWTVVLICHLKSVRFRPASGYEKEMYTNQYSGSHTRCEMEIARGCRTRLVSVDRLENKAW